MRISTRTRVVSVALLLLFAWWLHRRLADPPPGEQGEVVPADEDTYTAGIISSALDLIEGAQKAGDIHHRDVHAKAHGCVKARVEVGEVPEAFRHGVFAEPRSYDAWIRFSSGDGCGSNAAASFKYCSMPAPSSFGSSSFCPR